MAAKALIISKAANTHKFNFTKNEYASSEVSIINSI